MKNRFNFFYLEFPKPVLIGAVTLLLLVVVYEVSILVPEFNLLKDKGPEENKVQEIEEIKATYDLKVRSELYKKLILRVGPEQAQEYLYHSGLPFDGQTHLLNHVVGDFLYEKYGSAGLPYCRDYFLSSCYHGFILHAIAKGGMPEVAKSFSECLKFGPHVSMQCAHAIGHGFLANAGYKNLTQALDTCDQAISTMPNFPSFNCYDGVFMENIWAVHDDGEPSPDRWVKKEDPFYPCNDPRIGEKYLLGCWSNQPSLAYQHFGGDIKKVAHDVCNKLEEGKLQHMCFDGLARQIHPLTNGDSNRTMELCNLMPDDKWSNFCVSIIAGSAYSVGDRDVPFEICALVQESGKQDCYSRVFSIMRGYLKPQENLKTLCSKVLEDAWRKKCEEIY